MTRILIAYATSEGQTAHVAEFVAERLAALGHTVVQADLERSKPSPEGFDGVILGGSVHAGKFQPELRGYVATHHAALEAVPAWFFAVSLSEAIQSGDFTHENALKQINDFLADTAWEPREALSIGGALMYREYSWPKRLLMRQIVAKNGGQTDTSRDWEYTDWDAVREFANRVSRGVVGTSTMEVWAR